MVSYMSGAREAEPSGPPHSPGASELSAKELAWVEADNSLRTRAAALASTSGRDADDLYRTLKNLARSPAERLRLGLRHGRLHPDRRRATPPT